MDTNVFRILDRPTQSPTNKVYATVVRGGRILKQRSLCERCKRATYDEVIRELDVELYNNELAGFVWTDSADVVIDGTLANELKTVSLTGFSFQEVSVKAWWRAKSLGGPIINYLNEVPPPELFMLVIHGRAHATIPKTIPNNVCKVCNRVEAGALKEGFSIDTTKWDGTDIFYVREFPAIPIVSGNFSQKLKELGIDNFSLQKTEGFHSVTVYMCN